MLDKQYTMKNTYVFFFLTVLSSLLIAGCSSSRPFAVEEDRTESDSPTAKRMPLSGYEATLNPSDFDQEVEIVQREHGEEAQLLSPYEFMKDSAVVQYEEIQGFRIQIFSSSNYDDATMMKNRALGQFKGDTAYVVYDTPVYKVRVGDFVNRYEANQRLQEFKGNGYKDAWVVPDRIVRRKLVHIPIAN